MHADNRGVRHISSRSADAVRPYGTRGPLRHRVLYNVLACGSLIYAGRSTVTATTHDLVTRCFSYPSYSYTLQYNTINNTAPPLDSWVACHPLAIGRNLAQHLYISYARACNVHACTKSYLYRARAPCLRLVFQYWITNCISKDSIQVHILCGNAPQL